MGKSSSATARSSRPKDGAKAKRPKKVKKAKRPKYSAESPLSLTVSLPAVEEVPPPRWRAALARPLLSFVESLPEVTNSASGRKRANTSRAIQGLVALFLIAVARTGGAFFGVLGVLVALSLVFIPLSSLRKARWLHSIRRLMGGGEREVLADGTLRFDGTRVEVRDGDGRVWSSGRPLVKPHVVIWGERGQERWLGVLQPRGKKRAAAWFRAPTVESWPGTGQPFEEELKRHVEWGLDGNVEAAVLTGADFDNLLSAIGPPPAN